MPEKFRNYEYAFSEEEKLAIRDSLSDGWVGARKHIEGIANPSPRAVRRVRVLRALLEQFKTDCRRSK